MKVNELEILKEQLKIGFYNRLIKGKIKEAKDSLTFIFAAFIELNKIIPGFIQNLEEDSANQLNILWQRFKNLFYEFQALAEKELSITEQTFNEDPEAWKELLSSTFMKKVEELSSLLENMSNLTKVQNKPKEKLPPFEYSPKYAQQKEKDNRYSRYKKRITGAENRVLLFIQKKRFNVPGVTQKIQTGRWKDFLHADLPAPLNDHRIVYYWNGKIVKFEIIGTHKELGID